MKMPLALATAILLALVGCAEETPSDDAEPPDATAGFGNYPYCPDDTILCSNLPANDILLPQGCESFDQQCSRNFYSWQAFVSLNWPGKIINAPEGVQLVEPDPDAGVGDDGNRVWELWMDPDDVFLPGAKRPSWTPGPTTSPYCDATGTAKALAGRSAKASVAFDLDPDQFFEATIQQPLIDQDLNFTVFEIRMNRQEVGWVIQNGLYVRETVANWPSTDSLTMPSDAIETKASWRIIPDDMPAAQKERYYRQTANIVLDPSHVDGGGTEPVCLTRELGLVGLHIRLNGLWSTFEQVDNVVADGEIQPTYNNPTCGDCATNVPPTDQAGNPIKTSDYKWSTTGPSAALYEGFPNVPAQITRGPGQDQWIDKQMNHWWQTEVLQGTVWQHYMLITTNWLELSTSQPVPALNTTLEPFLPPHRDLPQACIDCHKLAVNGKGASMAETFLVFRACPKTSRSLAGDVLPPNCTPAGVDTLASNP
ncbi:MAG: hypothetical protein AAGN66_27790 [Acidobacteriota bacterium]